MRLPVRNLYCACCVDELEKTLRANPHIVNASVDFRGEAVTVRYHTGMIGQAGIEQLIDDSRRCSCGPEEPSAETAHIHHQAQMAPITMGTKQDRMQYEVSASGAHANHEMAHGEASSHAGMDHDMSDPKMAKAMERDM
jgi:cation transport ATPase